MKKKPSKKKSSKKLSSADLKKFNGGRPESCYGVCTVHGGTESVQKSYERAEKLDRNNR
jgi:hypothetical protein